MDCWARILGDCDEGASREHYITKGIFGDTKIVVFGLPWCNVEPLTIGIESAVTKSLCRKHNSRLSIYDDEAARLSKFVTAGILDRPTVSEGTAIDGTYLEKWALKTMLNLWHLGALDMGRSVDPPPALVKSLFSSEPLASPKGLYFLAGGTLTNRDFKNAFAWNGVRNVSDDLKPIVGMSFTFNELNFFFSTFENFREERLRTIGARRGIDYTNVRAVYRPNTIILAGEASGEKRIELDWSM